MSHEAAPSATAEQSVEQVESPYVEKAQVWKDQINTNDVQRGAAQEELDGLQAQPVESRDHARIRVLEKTLRHANKEQSVINAELHNAPDNLMRAERQVFQNFVKDVEGNVVSSPEKLIAGFDDKRASLTESIAELRDEIRSKQRAYGLNTIKAYEHKELGSKMKELNKHNDQLRQLNDAWISLGGEKVDAAREMVAVKKTYDSLPVSEGLAEIRSSQNQEEETPESVDDAQASSPNDSSTGSYQLELEAPMQNREHPDPIAETQAISDLLI